MPTPSEQTAPAQVADVHLDTFRRSILPQLGRPPEQPRTLIVLPESHLQSQTKVVLDFSQKLFTEQRPSNFRVFIEGFDSKTAEEAAIKHSVPVRGLVDKELSSLYWPIAFSMAITRFCSVAAANGDPHYPGAEAILLDAIESTSLTSIIHGEKAQIDILKIQEMVLTEIGYAAQHLSNYMRIPPTKLSAGIQDMPNCIAGDIPKQLRSLLRDTLDLVTPDKLARFKQKLQEANEYFGTNLESPALADVQALRRYVAPIHPDQPRLVLAHEKSRILFAQTRAARELCLFHNIAREPFDVAVLNIGWGHMSSAEHLEHLKAHGIQIHILSALTPTHSITI